MERYKVLVSRKKELEERLEERIKELREICIQEGVSDLSDQLKEFAGGLRIH